MPNRATPAIYKVYSPFIKLPDLSLAQVARFMKKIITSVKGTRKCLFNLTELSGPLPQGSPSLRGYSALEMGN